MQEPAVIVLLVHNAESRLKRLVERVFDATEEVARRLSVVVVDDGSTDDTYEVASELAVRYRQLRVLRQPRQSGLGAALERVRGSVSVRSAVVYDGTSPLPVGDLASMFKEPTFNGAADVAPAAGARGRAGGDDDQSRGSRRFAAVRQLNDSLERAHRPLTAFRWLPLDPQGDDASEAAYVDSYLEPPRVDTAHASAGHAIR